MPVERHIAVIDIGSNSVRLVIYEVFGTTFTPIYNEKILAGLGRDLNQTGKLHPQGYQLALSALKRFKILLASQGFETGSANNDILIAATAALRDAEDAKEFIAKVQTDIGFDISPLSGQQEAYMSAMGVLAGDSRADGMVADLGGASLELIEIDVGKPSGGTTYPLGPFSMFKGAMDIQALQTEVKKVLETVSANQQGRDLYLIGGAWRNLALIHQKRTAYPLRVAHNYTLSIEVAKELAQWAYSVGGVEEIVNWRGLSARRADTIPYSGLLLEVLLNTLNPRTVIIAPGGLREGVAYNALTRRLPENILQDGALFDACLALAKGRDHGVNLGQPLFAFLQGIESVLPSHFDSKNEIRLRRAACMLSGIGKGLHPDHKARMAFRTVLYAPLPDLTHTERAYLALIVYAAYTSKPTTPNDEAIEFLLSPEAQASAKIFGQAMRVGLDISGRSEKILSELSLVAQNQTLSLSPAVHAINLMTPSCQGRLKTLAEHINLGVDAELYSAI